MCGPPGRVGRGGSTDTTSCAYSLPYHLHEVPAPHPLRSLLLTTSRRTDGMEGESKESCQLCERATRPRHGDPSFSAVFLEQRPGISRDVYSRLCMLVPVSCQRACLPAILETNNRQAAQGACGSCSQGGLRENVLERQLCVLSDSKNHSDGFLGGPTSRH